MNLLHLWNRWECRRDKTVDFVKSVEYVGVLNGIWMLK